MLYGIVLLIHSLLRWVVLAAGVYAIYAALRGVRQREAYSDVQHQVGRWFVSSLHINLLLGVLLYVVLSPLTLPAFSDMAGTMKTSALRFFVVEHPTGMVLGTALATVGQVKVKRTDDSAQKHRRALWFFGAALIIILVSIPWPFYPAGRPLFHLPFGG